MDLKLLRLEYKHLYQCFSTGVHADHQGGIEKSWGELKSGNWGEWTSSYLAFSAVTDILTKEL